MEQYEIPPGRYYKILCDALKYFKAEYVYVRLVGSKGGMIKLSEDVRQKSLVLKQSRKGLRIIIDGKERFLFEVWSVKKDSLSGKRWSIAFFRVSEKGVMHYAHTGYPNSLEPYTGPDDPRLPEVKKTIFRTVNHDHLIEITFSEKIPIRRLNKLINDTPGWYYWDLDYAQINFGGPCRI